MEPVESQADSASWRSIAVRLTLSVAALVAAGFVLASVFEQLDAGEVWRTLRTLQDAEVVSIASVWMLMLAAQGLLTASLIEGLPVRHGVVAFLGPAAVAMVIPGPSDLPLRYRMLVSWGCSAREAGLAIAASGVFSIGTKLVLPLLAGATLLVADVPVTGVGTIIVAATLFLGAGVVLAVAILGSASRTEAVSRRVLEPIWLLTLRLARRRREETALVDRLLSARAEALGVLQGRWPLATWASFLTALATASLLLLCLRAMDVPVSDIRWTGVFVVFALVQGLTVIPITAGNAGVADVGYVTLLTTLTGPGSVNRVAAAVILFRVLTWLVLIPVGAAAVVVWRRGLRRAADAELEAGGTSEGRTGSGDPAGRGDQAGTRQVTDATGASDTDGRADLGAEVRAEPAGTEQGGGPQAAQRPG